MRIITSETVLDFARSLQNAERAEGTISKYVRIVLRLMKWLSGRPLTKETAVAWKKHLMEKHYKPATVNGMISASNAFFKFAGWEDCRLRSLQIQHRAFRDPGRNLTKEEYFRLTQTAYALGKTRLGLLMETICAAGIRVSEIVYITVEAARAGHVDVAMKGKIRAIMLPDKLCVKLLQYAGEKKIASGAIFVTRSGKCMSRHQIWAEMRSICDAAGVEPSKVFPHNLRHLFAREFYGSSHDIMMLRDLLGHSGIETTKIYLISTGEEHVRLLNRLGLVI